MNDRERIQLFATNTPPNTSYRQSLIRQAQDFLATWEFTSLHDLYTKLICQGTPRDQARSIVDHGDWILCRLMFECPPTPGKRS